MSPARRSTRPLCARQRRVPRPPVPAKYDDNVFINCPFDDDYQPVFDALVFAIHDAGFVARCALEVNDGTENRLQKIMRIVGACRYGIHDISRTEVGPRGLPRFNMPLELGLFLGAKGFGGDHHVRKTCLILDRDEYRYQEFISDIAGQDVEAHSDDPREALRAARNWLRSASRRQTIPGAAVIWGRYERFCEDLPEVCDDVGLDHESLTFVDYAAVVEQWLVVKAS